MLENESPPDDHGCVALSRGVPVNGIDFNPITRDGLIATVDRFVRCGRSHTIHFLSADPTVVAQDDPAYRAVLQGASVTIADGLPIYWVLRLGGDAGERIAGTEAFHLLSNRGR